MAALAHPLATVDDYFAYDLANPGRHEYYRGYIIAMAGGTFFHGLIISNLTIRFGVALEGRPCDVVASEVRLAAGTDALYTYPDLMVVCGKPTFLGARHDTLTNPIVIAEVLSPSTERADRSRRFAGYRQIGSLREYMMVSQFEPKVEVHRLSNDGHWTLFEFIGLDSSVSLESLGVEIPLRDIYRRVEFQPENVLEP